MKSPQIGLAGRVAIKNILMGGLWVLLSNHLVGVLINDPAELTIIQTYLGWIFTLISSLILFYYLRRENNKNKVSREDFSNIFEQAPEGIFWSTLENRYIKVNPAMARIYGYESPDDMISTITDISKQIQVIARIQGLFIENLLRNGFVDKFESRNYRKDGIVIWTSTSARVVLDEKKKLTYIEGFVEDITKRKLTEKVLQESEVQYRRLVEHSPYAIAVLSQDVLVYMNEAGVKLVGAKNAEELFGIPILEFIHPDSRFRITKILQDLQKGLETLAMEAKFVRKDGSIVYVEVTGYPFVYKNEPAIQVVIRDLTEQKQAEETLRANEETLRGIVDHTQNIYFSRGTDNVFTYISAQAKNILGYEPEDLLNNWQKLQTDHPINQRGIELAQKALDTGDTQDPYILELKAKNGNLVWVEVRETPVVREKKTVAIVGALTDITDRKKGEEDLERRLAELTVLHAVAMAGSQSSSEDDVIIRTTQIVSGMLYPDNCGVVLLNELGGTLKSHPSYWGINTLYELPLSLGITGQVATTGQPIRINDVTQHPAYIETTPGVRAELCVPIRVNEKIIGVFNVESRKMDAFDEEDERVMNTIAGALGTAIARIRSLITEQNRRKEAEDLREATAALTKTIELDKLFDIILESLSKLVPFKSASIELFEMGQVEIVAARGLPEQPQFIGKKYKFQSEKWNVDIKKPIIIPDVQVDEQFEKFEGTEYIRGWMGIPMVAQENLIGCINLDSDKVDFFTEAQAALVQTFVNQAATAIENARRFQEKSRRAEIIEVMAEIANIIATTREIGPALNEIANRSLELLKASHIAIYLLQDDNLTFKTIIAKGSFRDELMSDSFKIGEGITGKIIAAGKPEIIDDTRKHPSRVVVPGTSEEDSRLETMMVSPLILRGKAIGAINAWRLRSNGLFNESELNFLVSIAHQASIAIESGRLFQETVRHAQETAAIAEVGRDISATLELNVLLERIASYAKNLLNAETSAVYLADSNEASLHAIAAIGTAADEIKKYSLQLGTGILGNIAMLKIGEIVNNSSLDPRTILIKGTELNPYKHIMGVPIILKDHLTGLLVIWRSGVDQEFKPSDLNFLSGLAQQAAIAIENARLFEAEQRRRQEAEKLRLAATTIASSLNLKEILDILLKAMKDVVPYDSASILLAEGDQVRIVAAHGLPNLERAINRLFHANNQLLIYLRENNRPLILDDAQMDNRFERWSAADFVRGWMGIPLVARGQVLGYITLDSFTPCAFNMDMAELAQSFAHQAAAAIENAQLFENLQKSNLELSLAYDTTLEGWGKALELRDKETQGHTIRVAELTLRLARQIGMREPELIHVRRGVLVHDIGKMGVPDHILHKKTPLTKREWSAMREHPRYAFDLLYPISYLRPALDIAYSHHERWDGTGYPRGLKNEEIPLAARIFAVVDVWDALMSDRSYRAAWPRKKVIKHIRNEAGHHFDPQIVEIFLNLVEQENY